MIIMVHNAPLLAVAKGVISYHLELLQYFRRQLRTNQIAVRLEFHNSWSGERRHNSFL